jgi:hypothetical protein
MNRWILVMVESDRDDYVDLGDLDRINEDAEENEITSGVFLPELLEYFVFEESGAKTLSDEIQHTLWTSETLLRELGPPTSPGTVVYRFSVGVYDCREDAEYAGEEDSLEADSEDSSEDVWPSVTELLEIVLAKLKE